MKPLILIGSADTEFYLLLSYILEVEGYETVLARGTEEICFLAIEHPVKVILLDTFPGSFSAVEACSRLKKNIRTRGIVTVALIGPGAESQYLDLLKAGVDESFVRPMVPAKLLTYLRGLQAKPHPAKLGSGILSHAGIEMDLDRHKVLCAGQDVHLSLIEFKLLWCLMSRPSQVIARDELVHAAWPHQRHVEARTLNVHIGRLRDALRRADGKVSVTTSRGLGYALGETTGEELDDEPSSVPEDSGSDPS